MFTTQHYTAIAEVLRRALRVTGKGEMNMMEFTIDMFSDMFVADNPRFSRVTFARACGLPEGKLLREHRLSIGDLHSDIPCDCCECERRMIEEIQEGMDSGGTVDSL